MLELNKSFLNFYQELKSFFGNTCIELKGTNSSFNWPNGSGVYVVWEKKPDASKNLIYIGMTGKFSRRNEIIEFNGNQFSSRISRWTPYRFCESIKDGDNRYTFRYGPVYSNVSEQGEHKYDPNAYQHNIPYRNLHIDCFIINKDHPTLTPASLEAILLTKYLKEYGNLPPANNSL